MIEWMIHKMQMNSRDNVNSLLKARNLSYWRFWSTFMLMVFEVFMEKVLTRGARLDIGHVLNLKTSWKWKQKTIQSFHVTTFSNLLNKHKRNVKNSINTSRWWETCLGLRVRQHSLHVLSLSTRLITSRLKRSFCCVTAITSLYLSPSSYSICLNVGHDKCKKTSQLKWSSRRLQISFFISIQNPDRNKTFLQTYARRLEKFVCKNSHCFSLNVFKNLFGSRLVCREVDEGESSRVY